MGGEEHLFERSAADGFFGDVGAAGAQQFKTGLAAVVQLLRGRDGRRAGHHPKLGGRGVVDQQETALLVLNRDAGREHSENIS